MHLRDNEHFQSAFDYPIWYDSEKWYNLNYKSLKQNLLYYMNNDVEYCDEKSTIFFKLIIISPLNLLNIINELKENILKCLFSVEQLKYFCMYNTVMELILEYGPIDKQMTEFFQNSSMYFLRDFIFLILHQLENRNQSRQHKPLLIILHSLLINPLLVKTFDIHVLKTYFHNIVKGVVILYKDSSDIGVKKLTVDILIYLVNQSSKLEMVEDLLKELPDIEHFNNLREIHKSSLSDNGHKDSCTVINSFLQRNHYGIESLNAIQQFLAVNKMHLQSQGELSCKLISRFVYIVRESTNMELSLIAAKCLGEIGSLKLSGTKFYFQTDITFYKDDIIALNPILSFVRSTLTSLDKLFLTFKVGMHSVGSQVCLQLINSKHGREIIESFPYLGVFHSKVKITNYVDKYESVNNIDWINILKSTEEFVYEKWICVFVSKVFENCGWKDFAELSLHDTQFADSLLQSFIKLLMANKMHHLKGLIVMLEYFFAEFDTFQNITEHHTNVVTTSNKTIFKDKRIINKFLNICECVRIHNEWNVPINLLQVSAACNYCQAYFMSIMYLEIWALSKKDENDKYCNEIFSNNKFQEIAKKAYESIGCSAALSGFLNPLQSRINFLHLENNWPDVLLEANSTEMISDQLYTSILKRNGMLALANARQVKVDYEVCWRLCQWDTLVEGHSNLNTLNDMELEFEKHHFNALKCIYNREENNTFAAISNARQCVLFILKEISIECLQSVYKYLTWLQFLRQAEDFCKVQFGANTSSNEIFAKWRIDSDLCYGNFNCMEQILSHQISLFNTAGVRANRKIKEYYKQNPIESCLLKCIKECKKSGELNLAKSNISLLRKIKNMNEHMQAAVHLEDADICLKTGQNQIAKTLLQHILKNEMFAFCLERVRALQMYGEYLMETNSENFETVLSTYFIGSINLLNQFAKSKDQILEKFPNAVYMNEFEDFDRTNRKTAYESIAKYADREYTQLNSYLESDEFEMKNNIIKQNKETVTLIGKKSQEKEKYMGALFMHKFANLDRKELQAIEQKCTDSLCIAVENYINVCKIDKVTSSPSIYRIIALWFANKQKEKLQTKIREYIFSIPSYKFICALSQITARLNSKNLTFLNTLKGILIRCVQEHPQQTLYQLYPLVFAFNDGSADKNEDRVKIAKEIIAQSKNKSNTEIMKQLELMFPILIDFANADMSVKHRSNTVNLSNKFKQLKNLYEVQCPTVELEVSFNMNYKITSIVEWEDRVSLVGGINAPKKLMCLCSDGIVRPQLLKGKDDMRQDAVMQQVFSLINEMLKSGPESTNNNFRLRTYKVVPLSMRSGILEWCQNTIPIGAYLIGNGGAHKKYRPTDMTYTTCRQLSMQHLKSDFKKRYEIYLYLCTQIKPVFQYFFFEKFLIPGVWFERRLAYINSVATTSIVGYILGLGDRHTQNILIDEQTAEVIHIDFGIAFEQGKIMPTPETVPFRLTRDMVAPMGICKTHGTFKKSCEATMSILRRNQALITTILEVLLYDPLYNWKVMPKNTPLNGESSCEEKNLLAQRMLLAIQNKLEGKQSGIFGTTGVEVQVQRLINEAISSKNLCLLYPGWDPYL